MRRFFPSTMKRSGLLDHPNLVAYWGFNEGSGSALIDSSPNGNDAAITGSMSWDTGVIGQCIIFSGSSYGSVPHNASINITDQITISSFIRPERQTTQYAIRKGIQSSVDGYELSLASPGTVFFRINQLTSGNTYRVDSITQYPFDGVEWIHAAGTYDGTTLKMYINGVLENSSTPPPTQILTNELNLGIGAQSDGTTRLRAGTAMDDTRIYNIALTDEEISQIASIL